MSLAELEAMSLGRQAAKEGKSQLDNPYTDDTYHAECLAILWNHAFCEERYGTTVFD